MATDPRRAIYIISALAVIVGTVFVIRCAGGPEPTDEDFLRGLVDQMAAAAEKRDIKSLRQWLSRDYHDPEGRDYRSINAFLLQLFFRRGTLSVYMTSKTVSVNRSVDPLKASMKVTAVLTRSPKVKTLADILPHAARALAFDLTFSKKGGQWRLTSATWERVPDVRDLLGR